MTILAYWAAAHHDQRRRRGFLYPLGSGTLGYALPAALGAQAALPDGRRARRRRRRRHPLRAAGARKRAPARLGRDAGDRRRRRLRDPARVPVRRVRADARRRPRAARLRGGRARRSACPCAPAAPTASPTRWPGRSRSTGPPWCCCARRSPPRSRRRERGDAWAPSSPRPSATRGPYVPGPSLDELMTRHGLTEVAKLNWNEGLWGPLPGVLDAVAGALDQSWGYPEHAYLALREAIAAETAVAPGQVLPAHGIQALVVCSSPRSCGRATRSPCPTHLRALRPGLAGRRRPRRPRAEPGAAARPRAARRRDPRRGCPDRLGLRPRTTRRARASGRTSGARSSTPCRPAASWSRTRRTWTTSSPPTGPAGRATSLDGRRVVVLRTFSKIFGLAGLRLGYAIADGELVRLLHSVQEPFYVNRAALAAGLASLGRPAEVAARRAAAAAARDRLSAALRAGGLRPLPSDGNFVLVRGRRRRRRAERAAAAPRRARPPGRGSWDCRGGCASRSARIR